MHSVVLLLRPRADRGDLSDTIQYAAWPGRGRLEFTFEVVRLWQVPVERLLASGLGTLPLAVLGQLPTSLARDEALPPVIARLVERIEAEAPAAQAPILLTAAFVLTGLRVNQQRLLELFQGVRKMRESTAYQAILDEGRVEGRAEGLNEGRIDEARRLLLKLGRKKLGEPEATVEAALRTIDDLDRLERFIERVEEVAAWRDLLQTP